MSLALIPTTYVRNDDILVNSGVTIGAAVLELRAIHGALMQGYPLLNVGFR